MLPYTAEFITDVPFGQHNRIVSQDFPIKNCCAMGSLV
jgi:hypothetical protein